MPRVLYTSGDKNNLGKLCTITNLQYLEKRKSWEKYDIHFKGIFNDWAKDGMYKWVLGLCVTTSK